MPRRSPLRFRPNVAAVVRDPAGRILVCERVQPVGAWQFPQGGVGRREGLEQALWRELREEVSIEAVHCRIAARTGPYRYEFGPGRTKRGFDGQEQTYFLVDFAGPETAVNVDTPDREFRQFRWIDPREFQLDWLPEMKKDVYRRVLADFFNMAF